MDWLLEVYEKGGLSLLVITGLSAALGLLYRDHKNDRLQWITNLEQERELNTNLRKELARVEKEHAREMIQLSVEIARMAPRQAMPSLREADVEEEPTGEHNIPTFIERQKAARASIAKNLDALITEKKRIDELLKSYVLNGEP